MTGLSNVYAGAAEKLCQREPGPVWSWTEEMALAAVWLASSSAALKVNVNKLHIYGLAQEWDNQGL